MTAEIGRPKKDKCNTCKNKITNKYVMFDRSKYCLKCFYISGKSLPIFHEIKRNK